MAHDAKRRKLSNETYQTSSESNVADEEPQIADQNVSDRRISTDKNDLAQRRSLFIRSLAPTVTTEKLTEVFSQSFPLKHATVVLDPKTKTSRGFGFVTFLEAEDARNAVSLLNGSEIDGKKITVEVAEARRREVGEDIMGARTKTTNVKAEEIREVRRKRMEENKPPKLIVRNLPWSVNDADSLTKLFLSYGKVKSAVVPKAKTGLSAGFGFVVLRGQKNAENALKSVNGKEVDGRVLAVDWAVDKDTWMKSLQAEQKIEQDGGSKRDTGVLDHINVPISSRAMENGQIGDSVIVDDDDSDSDAVDIGGADMDEDEDAILDGNVSSTISTSDASESTSQHAHDNDNTVFLRNVAFTTDDDALYAHFKSNFGPVRYARVVYDPETERPKGTAFVAFYNSADAKSCIRDAPKQDQQAQNEVIKRRASDKAGHSLLQNDLADRSGKYTLDNRILSVARALNRDDATRRMNESAKRRDHDKRRLYLLSEGTVSAGSALYNALGKAEIDIRESSARQRRKLVKANPNLGLSLTRLSVRNLPRHVTSKDLKALARQGVVGFATDVKSGHRQPLSREELVRAAESDTQSEQTRKSKGKGIVKQVKIVYESTSTGSKVGEGQGGRSRGYGFIEYYSHRHALMGLRWLNGHSVKGQKNDANGAISEGNRSKRLIIEFAIENAQVVQRRAERERRVHEKEPNKDRPEREGPDLGKRKRDKGDAASHGREPQDHKTSGTADQEDKNKIAMRNRIIGEKRKKRKARKSRS